jgi:hypothetical protein
VSLVHAALHTPLAHTGALAGHCALLVHDEPDGLGTHAPLLHV